MVNSDRVSCTLEGGEIRAVGYIRVSTEDQARGDKVSLSLQREGILQRVEGRGWTFTEINEDHCSGDDPDSPGILKLYEDGKKRLYDVIVVHKIDRLTRFSFMDYRVAELVQRYGIKLDSVMEGDDQLTQAIHAAMAGAEKASILTRTKMGKDALARQGILPGGRHPFGYRRGGDRRPEVDPVTGPLVQEVLHLGANERLTGKLTASELEAWVAQLSPEGVGLSVSHIYKIWRNPLYWEGNMYYGQRIWVYKDGKKVPVMKPKEECIMIPFPPLVSKDLWDRAHARKAEAMLQSPRSMKLCYPLKGLLVCDHCDQPFRVKSDFYGERREKGQRVREKTDTHVRRYGCFICERPGIPAHYLEGKVWQKARKLLSSHSILAAGADLLNQEDDRALAADTAKAEKILREVRRQLERVKAMGRRGQLEGQELDAEFKLLRAREGIWKGKLDELQARAAAGNGRQALVQSVMEWSGEEGEGLEELGLEDQEEIIRLLFSEIRVDWGNRVSLISAVPLDEGLCHLPEEEGSPGSIPSAARGAPRRAYQHTEEISAGIRALLQAAGMTQGELAKRVGVSQRTVNRWVAGGLPTAQKLARLIEVADELELGVAFPFERALERMEAPHKLIRTKRGIAVQFTLGMGE